MLLPNGKFLTELMKLYQANQAKGSVWYTMKRTNLKPRKGKKDYSGRPYHCLVRATDGEKKLSTVVEAKDVASFSDSFNTIVKGHTGALKKRVRHPAKAGVQQ